MHVETAIGELVAQLPGVHVLTLGAPITLYLSTAQVDVFDGGGDLLVAAADARARRKLTWRASNSIWPMPTAQPAAR